MTLVVDLIGADGVLSEEAIAQYRGDAVQALASRMAEAIIFEASERGVAVVADDVFLWRRKVTPEDAKRMVVNYGAVWAPDPVARGVELFGGSHDGEVLTGISREDGPGSALPPPILRVMAEAPTSFDEYRSAEVPPTIPDSSTIVEEYVRAGIDSTKRRFIYKIKVQQ